MWVVALGAVAAAALAHIVGRCLRFYGPVGLCVGTSIMNSVGGSMPSTHATAMFFVTAAFMARALLHRRAPDGDGCRD